MEKIIEGNKKIAEFMGESYIEMEEGMICRCKPDGSPWDYDPLSWLFYERDWSELMPVVEKIGERMGFTILGVLNHFNQTQDYFDCSGIESIWEAVVQQITWYNQQSPSK